MNTKIFYIDKDDFDKNNLQWPTLLTMDESFKKLVGNMLEKVAQDVEFQELQACSGHECSIKKTGELCSICKQKKQ